MMMARTDPFRRNQHHHAPRAAEAASARLASDNGLLRGGVRALGMKLDSEWIWCQFQNNGQFYLIKSQSLFSDFSTMMKLDTNLKRKLAIRSSNAALAAIFFAGIIVGIVVTIIAIVSLPDASPGNSLNSSARSGVFNKVRLMPKPECNRFTRLQTSTAQQISKIFGAKRRQFLG
jgi:hypothetical protein